MCVCVCVPACVCVCVRVRERTLVCLLSIEHTLMYECVGLCLYVQSWCSMDLLV